MPTSATPYLTPPRPLRPNGEPRRVGLELELANLPLERVLAVIQAELGGAIEAEGPTQGRVVGTRLGTFKAEFDWTVLKERAYLRPLEQLGLGADSDTAQLVEQSVLRVAREFVPMEVVAPPVPIPRLHELDPVWEALRAAGGEGTRDSVLYAFGLHLNPELPDLDVTTTVGMVRAFLVLEDWLREVGDIDLARRVSPFIRTCPDAYRALVLAPSYAPSWDGFLADYVAHNPTRNRSLDLLPLLRSVCDVDLASQVDTWPLVQARPTFHYRLPNCELTTPGWTPALDWNRWIEVERLADNRALLDALAIDWLDAQRGEGPFAGEPWIRILRARLPHLPQVAPAP